MVWLFASCRVMAPTIEPDPIVVEPSHPLNEYTSMDNKKTIVGITINKERHNHSSYITAALQIMARIYPKELCTHMDNGLTHIITRLHGNQPVRLTDADKEALSAMYDMPQKDNFTDFLQSIHAHSPFLGKIEPSASTDTDMHILSIPPDEKPAEQMELSSCIAMYQKHHDCIFRTLPDTLCISLPQQGTTWSKTAAITIPYDPNGGAKKQFDLKAFTVAVPVSNDATDNTNTSDTRTVLVIESDKQWYAVHDDAVTLIPVKDALYASQKGQLFFYTTLKPQHQQHVD